jgi:uncharacterized protein YjaZ
MILAVMRTVASALGIAIVMQPAGVVLPVYRDLVKPLPFIEATYFDRCGVGSGPLEILRGDTPRRISAEIVRDLDAAGVMQLAERALARASRSLPGATVTVCLFPGELAGGLPYLQGVGGVSLGGGHIKLLLHPKPGGLQRVSYTVAHEYYHEVERVLWRSGNDPNEIMIREAKADYFATMLYPQLRPAHTMPLNPAELKQSLAELKEFQDRRAPAAEFRSAFMIGRNPRVLTWPGYRLGYEMVESYFGGQQVEPLELMKTPTPLILEQYRRSGRK